MAEYSTKEPKLAGKGGKDGSAYSDMGGAKVSGERKGAKLDSRGSDSKKKDLSSYTAAGIESQKKQAGAE